MRATIGAVQAGYHHIGTQQKIQRLLAVDDLQGGEAAGAPGDGMAHARQRVVERLEHVLVVIDRDILLRQSSSSGVVPSLDWCQSTTLQTSTSSVCTIKHILATDTLQPVNSVSFRCGPPSGEGVRLGVKAPRRQDAKHQEKHEHDNLQYAN